MKSVAQEVAPRKINVNGIYPVAIRTPVSAEAWNTPEAYAASMKPVPYGRIGEPEDIGYTCANIYVDSGMTSHPGFDAGG
jgi:glucose 1-dehydrogenase